jgi:hypothetical protein
VCIDATSGTDFFGVRLDDCPYFGMPMPGINSSSFLTNVGYVMGKGNINQNFD